LERIGNPKLPQLSLRESRYRRSLGRATTDTVSYFEQVKNITHMAFGLMERRRWQNEALTLAAAVEKMTGLEFPRADIKSVLTGAREIDLVRSRLEEKMRTAYREMSELWNGHEGIVDLRTAAYVIALRRLAARYEAVGI
jgi:glutamate dehydrogenase (NAD(P)+)